MTDDTAVYVNRDFLRRLMAVAEAAEKLDARKWPEHHACGRPCVFRRVHRRAASPEVAG